MALRGFLTVVGRRLRLVVGILVACVAGAWLAAVLATPTYTATAALYFSVGSAASVDDLQQGASFTQNQMASFASLVTTPAVLQPVIDELDLPGDVGDLADQLDVTAPNNTVLLEVEVTDVEPVRAAQIADVVADQVITVVEDLAPTDPTGDQPAVEVTVVQPATTPESASSPDLALNLAAGVVVGLGLGVLAALGREALDTRLRGAADVAGLTNRPVIGTLGSERARRHPVVVESDRHGPQAEAYRQLRTNLEFLDVGDRGTGRPVRRVLVVTSSLAGEGKTTVALNLAATLAETSARVLLVEADLRRPSVADRLGLEGSAGLTTVLTGQATVADVVQDWGTSGLQVMASGVLPPNPTELLGSPAMRRLLEDLRREYDHIVLDGPPLLPVADGAVLAGLADGTVLLANVTKVRRHQLAEGLRTLARVEASVLGVVLNQVARDLRVYGYSRDADPVGTLDGPVVERVPVR